MLCYVLAFLGAFLVVAGSWEKLVAFHTGHVARIRAFLDDNPLPGTDPAEWTYSRYTVTGLAAAVGYLASGFALVAPITGLAGWWIWSEVLQIKTRARRQTLEDQLEMGLMTLANSVRSGFTLVQAVDDSPRMLPDPISDEFGRIGASCRMGFTIDQALLEAKPRFKSEAYDLAVTAILVAQKRGGDIAATLGEIANWITEAGKLRRKTMTMSKEARLQFYMVIGFEVFFVVLMMLMMPDQYGALFDTIPGRLIFYAVLFINLVCYVWAHRITQIEV